jgi:hypothetical protein
MKNRSTTFRPWPENQKRLELASRIGINVSELINEVLEQKLDDALKRKSKQIQNELNAIPA